MAKQSKLGSRPPVGATATLPHTPDRFVLNHEGEVAWEKDAKTALYTLLVTEFYGEGTFYESADARGARLRELVERCAREDADWTRALILWTRKTANIRTAALVAAVEYARVGGGGARGLIRDVATRADEPAEMLAYWLHTYGRKIRACVKRGVADAAVKLYDARGYVKWDSPRATVRMADVVDLCHPKPRHDMQAALFRRMLEDRHGRSERLTIVPPLDRYNAWIANGADVRELPEVATWENVSGQHSMGREDWEAVIPEMGYMALLRNLRNFEQAKVSSRILDEIAWRLEDPREVARSRQLPFRFWSAWKHSGTLVFGSALERALELSTRNITPFGGRTLVMVDKSGSMMSSMGHRGKISRAEAAALFGVTLATRDSGVDLWLYDSKITPVEAGVSVLRTMDKIRFDGGATRTWTCTQDAWTRGIKGAAYDVNGKVRGLYDRILIITDEQAYGNRAVDASPRSWQAYQNGVFDASPSWVPDEVPVYSWDLSGYATTSFELGAGRYQFGGLSDASFGMVRLLEQGRDGAWPWETDDG